MHWMPKSQHVPFLLKPHCVTTRSSLALYVQEVFPGTATAQKKCTFGIAWEVPPHLWRAEAGEKHLNSCSSAFKYCTHFWEMPSCSQLSLRASTKRKELSSAFPDATDPGVARPAAPRATVGRFWVRVTENLPKTLPCCCPLSAGKMPAGWMPAGWPCLPKCAGWPAPMFLVPLRLGSLYKGAFFVWLLEVHLGLLMDASPAPWLLINILH